MTDTNATDGPALAIARRYQPVIVSLAVILIALLVAPRADHGRRPLAALPVAAPAAHDGHTEAPKIIETPSTGPSSPATFDAPPRTVRRSSTAEPPVPVLTPQPTTPVVVPLQIVASGWSGADGGTPVAGADVPDGSLPVSSGTGEQGRRSYLKLKGTAHVLTLSVVSDPVGSRFAGNAAVWICPLAPAAAGVPIERAMPDANAPAYDCTTHVAGVPGAGAWTFDLASIAPASRTNGFALVPAEGASDFQILFGDTT